MRRVSQHKQRLIEAATRLFRRHGFASTGINEILIESGAPKGSLYHYFPEGKIQIGEAAVHTAGAQVAAMLDELLATTQSAGDFLEAYAEHLAQWLRDSEFQEGCPIATTLLETTPQSDRIVSAGEAVIECWLARVSRAFERDGVSAEEARDCALAAISAFEGALLLARVQRSTRPLEAVVRHFGPRSGRALEVRRTAANDEPAC